MGLYDRDYMRRPPEDEDSSRGTGYSRFRAADEVAEDFAQRLLKRYRTPLIVAGVALAILVLVGLIWTKLAQPGQ